MVILLYGAVILLATFLGAFVGLGGGVIIKPVLDFLGRHPLEQITFFSSCGVFTMSLTATAKHIKQKTPMDKKMILLIATGSTIGGYLGNVAFRMALTYAQAPSVVRTVQSVCLGILLIFVLASVNCNTRTFHLKNPIAILFSGLFLGFFAAFLGIGGGPINVAAMTLLFSLSMKDAAVYSVAVIFFSQGMNLLTTLCTSPVGTYDLTMLWGILPCAILGGLIGAKYNRKCKEKTIRVVFTATVSAIVLLTFYNAIMPWF